MCARVYVCLPLQDSIGTVVHEDEEEKKENPQEVQCCHDNTESTTVTYTVMY